jgi:hypothetical protein
MSGILYQVGGKNKQEPEVFKSARAKINTAKGDINNIKNILKELWGKVTCPAGKTKPNLNLNLPSDGKQASANANNQINALKAACGSQYGIPGTPGTPGTTDRFPDITVYDVDALYKKLERKLNEYNDMLKGFESQIDATKGLEGKSADTTTAIVVDKAKPLSPEDQIKRERQRSYGERLLNLQRDVETLKEEISAIVSFVQKGTKDTTPFLSNYYKTLIAIQSALIGGIVTDTSSGSFVSGRESDDRLARLAKDITGRIISLKLDLQYSAKKAIVEPTVAPPAKIDFITNTDIQDPAKLKEYLTSSKPYYYFDLYGSLYDIGDKITHTGKKGTIELVNFSAPPTYTIKYDDGTHSSLNIPETAISPADATPTGIYKKYRDKDVYAKIEAINGAGFLELIKQYTRIKSTLTEEEAFAFENDLCKHVFRLPAGIKSISYKDMVSTETGKTQLGFLAVIHQMHFIGTLMKRQIVPIQASINPKNISAEEASATAAIAAADTAKNKKEGEKNATDKQLQSAKTDFDTKTKAMTSIPMTKETLIQWMRGTNAEAKANRDLEAQFQTIENTLTPLQKEKEESQTKIDELREKYNKYVEQQKSYLAATTLDYATLKDLQIKMNSLNDEKTLEEKHNTDITASISLIQQNLENIVRDPNTSDIFVARFKDVEMAQKKVKELEAKLIQDQKELDLATTIYDQATALLAKIQTEKGTEDQIYMVPNFRPVSTNNTNTIDTASRNMFVAKYKYTQLFNLNDLTPPPLPPSFGRTTKEECITDIDACVKGIFKLVQDPTYSIQTLSKVQARLKGGNIIPKLGETEKEAASKPGTVKTLSEKEISSDLKDALSAENSERSTHLNQIRNTIIQLAIDFLSAYQPSYLTELGFIKGKPRKEDPGIINKIDSAIQRSVASLRKDPTKTKYDLDIIEQKYAKIKEYINEYVRIK